MSAKLEEGIYSVNFDYEVNGKTYHGDALYLNPRTERQCIDMVKETFNFYNKDGAAKIIEDTIRVVKQDTSMPTILSENFSAKGIDHIITYQ